MLYDAVAQFRANREITVDSINLAFFKDVYPSVKTGKYSSIGYNSRTFYEITEAVSTYADGFVSIVREYLPANGSISEQYNRTSGQPLSAYDLTWSFASFITMSERRSGYYPASWGSRREAAPKCGTAAPQGTYVPALAAGAPNVTETCTVSTTFNVNASTYYGENIYLIGKIIRPDRCISRL